MPVLGDCGEADVEWYASFNTRRYCLNDCLVGWRTLSLLRSGRRTQSCRTLYVEFVHTSLHVLSFHLTDLCPTSHLCPRPPLQKQFHGPCTQEAGGRSALVCPNHFELVSHASSRQYRKCFGCLPSSQLMLTPWGHSGNRRAASR